MNAIDARRDSGFKHQKRVGISTRRNIFWIFHPFPHAPVGSDHWQCGGDNILLLVETVAPTISRNDRHAQVGARDFPAQHLGHRFAVGVAAKFVEAKNQVVGACRIDPVESFTDHPSRRANSPLLDFWGCAVLGASGRKPFSVPDTYRDGGQDQC